MPTVVSFANMKGGVGKTTLCVNLAYTFFLNKKRVLIVDNDPQFNATTALLKPQRYIDECIKTEKHPTIYNIYERPPRVGRPAKSKTNPKDFFIKLWWFRERENVSMDLIASRLELYETLRNPSQKEYKLNRFLKEHASTYDWIFIDCPPTPSVLTLSAFAASDYVLIPVTPDYFSSFGLPQFLATLNEFKADLVDEHEVRALGVVFTNVPRQASRDTQRATQRVTETIREQKSDIPVFSTKLSHLKVFEKALWQSNPVHQIEGKGTRGKTEAMRELSLIAHEISETIDSGKVIGAKS